MHFLVSLIEKYGLLAVFLNLFVEGMGIPLPSYPILMIATAMAAHMHYSYSEIILTGMSAALLADACWYWGGRHYGTNIVKFLCRISLSPESCERNTHLMFTRVGPSSLGFAKFIPGFSSIGIVLASAMRTPLLPVIFFDVLGVLVYISLGVALGAVFHNAIADALDILTELGKGGFVIIAASLALFWAGKWAQRKHFMRQLRMNRISAAELRDLIVNGDEPVILDVRPQAIRRREGVIPGSIVAHERNLKAIAKRYSGDREVVVYCSCPNEASAVLMARKLRKAGFKKIRPLQGGIDAWLEEGAAIEQESLAA
ncbi:MAG: DedA family protein/thiosulfate sulfurtransferase GlpE [Alphaproteobacteria bacterium]|nr:DedA family protein/thiosulfate sulfurtransferase GlpE [Alphaproteobacteria bacterium]